MAAGTRARADIANGAAARLVGEDFRVNEREISLSLGTFIIAACMLISQCTMSNDLDRIADTNDAMMCIEGFKAGIGKTELPKACKDIGK